MRASDSRLAERLMFVAWVTTNLSQRIGGRPVHHPAPVTFILSQLGVLEAKSFPWTNDADRAGLEIVTSPIKSRTGDRTMNRNVGFPARKVRSAERGMR